METKNKKPLLDKIMKSSYQKDLADFDPNRIVSELLKELPDRARDIIVHRFGLEGKRVQTLEELGEQYKITRERVRQIQSTSFKNLRESSQGKLLDDAARSLSHILSENGNAMIVDDLIAEISDQDGARESVRSAILFVIQLREEFKNFPESGETFEAVGYKIKDLNRVKKVIDVAVKILEEIGHPVSQQKLIKEVRSKLTSTASSHLSDEAILAYLKISKRIRQNPFEEWGLKSWREIIPRGVRDKAYLVLKKADKPMHFAKITKEINARKFDHRVAHPQTVHNELIKDKRFVLVGRGIYALAEWGYKPGTVADVLERILKEAGQPLTRQELVEKVLAERIVRKNTILIGLQEKSKFKKVGKDKYTLTES